MTNEELKQRAEENLNQIRLYSQIRKMRKDRKVFTEEDVKKAVRKYQQTKKGIITLRYSWLKKQAQKKGLAYPTKEEFEYWSENDYDLQGLYFNYSSSGFKGKFSPVIRREDEKKGFTTDNLIWLVNIRNSGAVRIEDEWGEGTIYSSATMAEKELFLPQGVLNRALRTTKKYKRLKIDFA
jgi:hypothetical protein